MNPDALVKLLLGNAKAVIAAATGFLGGIQVGLDGGLSAQESIGAAVAGLVALAAVFVVPNAGQVSPQEVVDAVKAVVPPDLALVIEEAVAPVGRGVLRTVK